MMKKALVLAAGAVGYVLGARAGRERYEQMKSQFDKMMRNPKVQQAASDAQDFAAEKAPIVKDKAASTAKKAADGAQEAASKAASMVPGSKDSSDEPKHGAEGFSAPATGLSASEGPRDG